MSVQVLEFSSTLNDKHFSRCRNHDVICLVFKLLLVYKSKGQVVFYKFMT